MYKMMTPGPVMVAENVRMARSRETGNPDLDLEFYDFYRETCALYSSLLHTDKESLILSGEGILGLEAGVASITEPGDRVLVLDNGVFGKGFADFVSIYGGEPVLYSTDYKREIEPEPLRRFLEKDAGFKYATVVHCDTPSGMLNDISAICPLLKEYGILTVVDSVSGMFGNEVNADAWGIDILCGGSQKAVSCPIGLTMVTISDEAKRVMENRKTRIASFYANLLVFKDYYENKWFPYTMPISDIYGLRQALENIKADKDILNRHARIAAKTREALTRAGLHLYAENGYSNTVTVFTVPGGVTAADILKKMREDYQIMLAGSFDVLAGEVIRIGHMGYNCTEENMKETLSALNAVLSALGVKLEAPLEYGE
ncbi:MAG: alanine--glyoxylate aminotransferase family protein [Bacteroidales bacterium]|nr:alanine--glyoxylate aminotransferase family protein [Clostridium sp.]MCM1204547.1 alanine--glyoxylate aminotransferase family protein [Bacteroidales bacterium]